MKNAPDTIIDAAANAAYEEDAEMVVGRIDGTWQYCHNEEMGRQAQMIQPMYLVGSSGILCELDK